jgi:iron complex outermembrane recepter protein
LGKSASFENGFINNLGQGGQKMKVVNLIKIHPENFKHQQVVHRFIYGILMLVAIISSTLAIAQDKQESSDDSLQLEEITITGIRGSLQQSTDDKRKAEVIVDSITSEDIGKFPESNVAEALQRITGVTIARNRQGEGSDVTVRGFGPGFNTVLINGRSLPSFQFDTVSSELISGAEVFKTSSADQQEGGIGGLIDLKMMRPFDYEGRKVVLSAKGTYEKLSGDTAPSVFALYSNTFADDKWGAMISISHQKRKSRYNSSNYGGYSLTNVTNTNDNGTPDPSDDTVTPVAENVYFPGGVGFSVHTSDLSRTGINGALQFKPTNQLQLTLDALWNQHKPNDNGHSLNFFLTSNNISDVTIGEHDTVTSLTTNTYGHADNIIDVDHVPRNMYALGFNADWKSTDEMLKLKLDVSTSKTSSKDPGGDSGFLVVGNRIILHAVDNGNGIPTVYTDAIPSLGIPANAWTDKDIAKAHFIMYGGTSDSSDVMDEGKLDGELDFNNGLLSKLLFGMSFSSRTKKSDSSNFDPCPYCGYNSPVDPGIISVFDAGSDFLGGGNHPTAWMALDPDAYVSYLRELSGNPNLYTPQPSPGPNVIKEQFSAVYLNADFSGETGAKPWSVNAGLRFVRTKLNSSGYGRQLVDLLNIPGDPTMYNGMYGNGGSYESVTAIHTYNNLLPTFNAKINLTDEIILRFAASKSLTRPNLNDLSPTFNYSVLRPQDLEASAGNPDLKPYVSTNFDTSFEWYFNRSSSMAVSLFNKKVDDYIITSAATENLAMGNSSGNFPDGTAAFRVSRPRNVECAKVKGLEIAFQHYFFYLPAPFDGFGLTANATFVKSPDTMAPGDPDTTRVFALQGVGNSQNLMIFYEKGPIGVRSSYNHRDDFLQGSFTGQANEPTFVKAAGQLDLQASYQIAKDISVTLDCINVTNTPQETYGRYKNQTIGYTETGSRYTLGIRAAF